MKSSFVCALCLLCGLYCSSRFGTSDPGYSSEREIFSVFYNEPGQNQATMVDKKIDNEIVRLIDRATQYVYLAAFNFNRQSIVDALIRAKGRGLDVRFVGDIDEFYSLGYQTLQQKGVNYTLGNAAAIQHNKFVLVDDAWVFTGTGNFSDTDLLRNNNNWYLIQSASLVALYKAEFLQMHAGLFGTQKRQRSQTTNVIVNSTPLEIYFSPYSGQAAMDRIIALVDSAKTSIHYMIFAFTHDELSAALVRAARQRGIAVYGIHDSQFVNGVSNEAARLHSASFLNGGARSPGGPYLRRDGNENTVSSINPTHGGKMHAKTLIIDAGTPNARMATGSFNWSDNAVQNNDENLLIVNQARIANAVYEQWKGAWALGQDMQNFVVARGHTAAAGDILISELGWAGSTDGTSLDRDDDFIEIFNNSAAPIDLSHWSLEWSNGFRKNLYPVPDSHNWYYENLGSCAYAGYTSPQPNIICPGQVRIFYNKKPSAYAETGADEQITYDSEGRELRAVSGGSLSTEHFKFSGTKNFKLTPARLEVKLYDKAMNLIDSAGNGYFTAQGAQDDYSATKATQSIERRGYSAASQKFTNHRAGTSESAWFTHPTSEAYNCGSRQDYSSASPPEGCLTRALTSYSSAGYIYAAEGNPKILRAEATSTTELVIIFDSDMTTGATNCIGSPLKINFTLTQGGCGAPTIAALQAGADASKVKLTIGVNPMSSPTCRYLIQPAATCVDNGNRSASASSLHLNGPAPAFANAIINEVCVTGCPAATYANKDWAEIKITSSGTARGLKLFYLSESENRLIYEFNDIYATVGSILSVGIAQAAFSLGDRTSGTLIYPLAISLREQTGFDATDGVFVLSYCATGENDAVDTTLAECNLAHKGIQDVLYYSDRDGSLSNGISSGALTHVFSHLKSFWPLPENPAPGLNDRAIQLAGACIAADTLNVENSAYFCSNSGAGIARAAADSGTQKGLGKAAWRLFSSTNLSPAAANSSW